MSNTLLPMNAHTLVVAEKPSVGQTIAAVIGATEKKDGFLLGNGWIVTWCVGHLVELAMPQDYDEPLLYHQEEKRHQGTGVNPAGKKAGRSDRAVF